MLRRVDACVDKIVRCQVTSCKDRGLVFATFLELADAHKRLRATALCKRRPLSARPSVRV